jgi:eukaryotic-like serine/threonine-protein kinase
VPPWLQEVILRCLEVDPNARYATAAQLAFDLQHPDLVAKTARSERLTRDGTLAVFKRWLRARKAQPRRRRNVSGLLARAPIIMAAIDLAPESESMGGELALAVRRVLATEPSARLACVNVLKGPLMTLDPTEDVRGRTPHLQRLIELKHWARVFSIDEKRMTYHVIESPDPAVAILDYARNTRVDHIVIGASGDGSFRRNLGSVAAKVAAEAPCTVTVVRAPPIVSGRPIAGPA